MSLIYQVDDVLVELQKSNPPKLLVKASGLVPTSGWSNPVLSPYFYVMPPADGIQDFSFVAEPPSGPANQVLTKISAQIELVNPAPWIRGVRVHAVSNCREELIGAPSSLLAAVASPLSDDAQMKPVNLKVSVAKNDRAYTWSIMIEGREFFPPQFKYDGKFWTASLPGFPVNGPLDAILIGTGSDNGVQRGKVAARLEANGQVLAPDLYLETVKNHGVDRRSYNV